MNSELAKLFRVTNWCKIADSNKNLDEELYGLRHELKHDSPSCIDYTFDVIESIDRYI